MNALITFTSQTNGEETKRVTRASIKTKDSSVGGDTLSWFEFSKRRKIFSGNVNNEFRSETKIQLEKEVKQRLEKTTNGNSFAVTEINLGWHSFVTVVRGSDAFGRRQTALDNHSRDCFLISFVRSVDVHNFWYHHHRRRKFTHVQSPAIRASSARANSIFSFEFSACNFCCCCCCSCSVCCFSRPFFSAFSFDMIYAF